MKDSGQITRLFSVHFLALLALGSYYLTMEPKRCILFPQRSLNSLEKDEGFEPLRASSLYHGSLKFTVDFPKFPPCGQVFK